jgi:zinc transporter
MLDVPDPNGLVCGYVVDPTGALRSVDWREMDDLVAQDGGLVWLHFNQADGRARQWIEACGRIPPAAKAILLGSDAHMRIEAAGAGLAGIVGDLHHEFVDKSDELDVLRLYLDSTCLISTRRRPLQAIDKLRQALGEGLRVDRPIGLLTHFLHHVTDTLGDLILRLTGDVDESEDRVLAGRPDRCGEELGRIRRVAARLRRHMVPQQHALIGLLTRLPSWVGSAEAGDLRGAIERLTALGHDLDLVQERARLLQEQASTRLMETTNRNLYVLSIVTTVFLPMTLITGVFGMNLGGMPGVQDAAGFWYGLLIMAATGLVTLVVFWRARLF